MQLLLIYFLWYQVTLFEDFFGEEDVFFVYGSERYAQEDFELDDEGMIVFLMIEEENFF